MYSRTFTSIRPRPSRCMATYTYMWSTVLTRHRTIFHPSFHSNRRSPKEAVLPDLNTAVQTMYVKGEYNQG